jgi:hypothetical protein
MNWIEQASLSRRGRFTGLIYLLYFLTAVISQLFVAQHAAYNLINLVANVFYLILTLLFYYLFKPVNKGLSFLAALSSLLGCVVASLGLFGLAFHINPLLFFGPFCILIGYLILKSTFLPRIPGVLLMVAGFAWLALLTPLAKYLSSSIMVFGFVAEAILMLWLLVKGVNVQRWKEQAGR